MAVFGDGASKAVIRVIKWGPRADPWSDKISVHIRRDTREVILGLSLQTHTKGTSCKFKTRFPTCQQAKKRGLRMNPTLPAP